MLGNYRGGIESDYHFIIAKHTALTALKRLWTRQRVILEISFECIFQVYAQQTKVYDFKKSTWCFRSETSPVLTSYAYRLTKQCVVTRISPCSITIYVDTYLVVFLHFEKVSAR
jgi:hypothetical protein